MYLFAAISIGIVTVLTVAVILATRAEFRKMNEHPEHYPDHFSH